MNTHAYFRNLAVINLPNFIFYFSLNLVLFLIISITAEKPPLQGGDLCFLWSLPGRPAHLSSDVSIYSLHCLVLCSQSVSFISATPLMNMRAWMAWVLDQCSLNEINGWQLLWWSFWKSPKSTLPWSTNWRNDLGCVYSQHPDSPAVLQNSAISTRPITFRQGAGLPNSRLFFYLWCISQGQWQHRGIH